METLAKKKILFVITKSNWGNALWKPTVFQRSLRSLPSSAGNSRSPTPSPRRPVLI